ncbi:Uncharacterized protein Rs2_39328 [Raphanus sativus]|nr:Uncharacterized protein Rs2_39328 [Raphanus sativus]
MQMNGNKHNFTKQRSPPRPNTKLTTATMEIRETFSPAQPVTWMPSGIPPLTPAALEAFSAKQSNHLYLLSGSPVCYLFNTYGRRPCCLFCSHGGWIVKHLISDCIFRFTSPYLADEGKRI